uniref:DNA repair endonuclease XPF n=1 Tax=Sarcoptes scabiei TaxID=52283 RepID=A0A834RCI2_SARSC
MDCLLEFERDALLNVMHENSLTISSKGLLNDRLLFHLVRIHCNQCHLVLVIGTNIEEENSILKQIDESISMKPAEELKEFQRPKQISYSSEKSSDRRKIYLDGGVFFISSRLLLTDMLTKRIPFESISGIIVVNAHRIMKDCHMRFILRLYRMNNKTGFITALSQTAHNFVGSFGRLEKMMRWLFVGSLFLWPRFESKVIKSLSERKVPKVIECRIEMTPIMKQIQFAIIDLLSRCIDELNKMDCIRYTSPFDSSNSDEDRSLNAISVISNNFNRLIRLNLDSVWFQLTSTARSYIGDINQLKSLLFHLTEFDSVRFYAELENIRNTNSPDNIVNWVYWPAADTLFRLTEERIFKDTNGNKRYNIEINPKLETFAEILNDIEKEIEAEQIPADELVDIIVVVENSFTTSSIKSFQDKGRDIILDELERECEAWKCGKKISLIKSKKSIEENKELENQITLTQMMNKIEDHELSVIRKHSVFQIHFYEWSRDENAGLNLKNLLTNLRPRYVILYDAEISVIRQIEIYQALYGEPNQPEIQVFFLIFDGSAEEQRYLRKLQVEKESFEKLILEKHRLPKTKENEGLVGEHPDLVRGKNDFFHAEDLASKNSRIGGGENTVSAVQNGVVLIDHREIRSMLPSYIHMIGIDLEPITLDIGDYIITPECCIERKAISDLIRSLNSGRLYSQAQIMCRHYKRPILLIEFPDEEQKSFNFQSKIWGDVLKNSKDNYSRPNPLVQIAVLTIQFPLLKIIWSPSMRFTAEVMYELKRNKPEPNAATDVIKINVDQGDRQLAVEFVTDRFDFEIKDFLLCLPGINTENVYTVMNSFVSIVDLVNQSIEELTEKMGSSQHAELLYKTLHDTVIFEAEPKPKPIEKKARFTYTRKRKIQK